MPKRAKTPCRYPGCAALVETPGYCDKHRRDVQQQQDERRGSSTARGYGWRWRQARERYLSSNPLCILCRNDNRITAATVVDHIIAHKGDQQLFWDQDNWQPLCKEHHDSKTAREDGGFGRNFRK